MEASIEKQPVRILFLASEPTNAGRLRLGAELQEVRNRLSANSSFEIKDRQAVKPDDALQTILNYKPHIVHFSGHGQESGEICFEDEQGNIKTVPPDALASIFELVNEYVKCVLINACYSELQAKAISQFVPIVIGTKKEISDSAAIKFSTGFYSALDSDLSQKNLKRAYDSGCIAIRFENLPENLMPVINEGSPEIRFSSEIDSAFISLSQPKGIVFEVLKKGLSLTGKKLGLSDETVSRMIQDKIDKLEQHNRGMADYENSLKNILREENPLSEKSQFALLQLQKGLDLTDLDVANIRDKILSDPSLDSAANWYDRGLGQEIIGNFNKAIDYFSKAIEKVSDYSAAYYRRGVCNDGIGNLELAISDFTKAIEHDNEWELNDLSLAYYSRARSYSAVKTDDKNKRKGLLNLSLADWNKTLELKSNQPEANYGRGLVYFELAELTGALEDFKKAYESTSSDTRKQDCLFYLKTCYDKLGQSDEYNNWINLHKN